MRLEKVRIKGFRNFDDTEVIFQKKTLIIGANDVGKSNLLYALRILFDKTISEHDLELTESDYNAYSGTDTIEASVYKGYKRDKIEMRGDRAEISDFPLYLNTVAGGFDCRDQTIGGFSFVVKIYAVPVVEIIG